MSTASGPKPSILTALGKGINLLALDGGGVRGVSELLVLKELMNRVQDDLGEEYAKVILRPCDIFHIIGGSGTGGLNAILLGRLGLTVDEAILCYDKISKVSFSSGNSAAKMSADLERQMKGIVKKHGAKKNPDEMMEDMNVTKTFVLAMAGENLNANIPHFFRTYKVRSNRGPNCKVWEAVRATTASRGIFNDMNVGSPIPMRYVGTTLGNNNPTQRLIEEAKVLFPNEEVGALVSVGAGHPGVIELPSGSSTKIQKTLEEICKDCEETHEYTEKQALSEPYFKDRYWRLSVEHGMNHVKLQDADSSSKIAAHTRQYLLATGADQKMNKLVEGMVNRLQQLSDNSQTRELLVMTQQTTDETPLR